MLDVRMSLDRGSMMETLQGLTSMGKAQGLTVQFVCWDAMRLWTLDMAKRTAPWADGKPGTGLKQRNVGQGAVSHDLDVAFARLDPKRVAWWERKGTNFVKVKENGVVFPVDAALWKPDIEKLHKALRNKSGRVPRQNRQAWVDPKNLKQYEKTVHMRVGSLKAGWLPAMYHYASLSNGSTGKIPQWIAGQGVKAGAFGGNMDKTGNGSIYAENTAHHSDAIMRRRADTVEWSRNHVEKIMRFSKNGINVRMQRLVDQFNAGRNPKAELRAA